MGNNSGRLRRKLNRQAGLATTEPRKPGLWKGLTEARMPHFALDSVVVTVDGWDHLFNTGSKFAYCRFFLAKICGTLCRKMPSGCSNLCDAVLALGLRLFA